MRLIDANTIKQLLREYCVDGDELMMKWYNFMCIDDVVDIAPTVDAVPVVRCRNCKYWDEHSQYGYDSDHGVYGNYCMLWTPDDDFYAVETPEDGFCYNGERKDDEDR